MRGARTGRGTVTGALAAGLLLLTGCTSAGAGQPQPAPPAVPTAVPSSAAPSVADAPPRVAVRAVERVAEKDRWVLDMLTAQSPETRQGHPAPTADQLMVVSTEPNGESVAAWLPDSWTVCVYWLARQDTAGEQDTSGGPWKDSDFMHTVACGEVPYSPGSPAFREFDDFGSMDHVVLLAGADGPITMTEGYDRSRYGALHQRQARGEDGRAFQIAAYRLSMQASSYSYDPLKDRPTRLCAANGQLCREPFQHY